MNDFSLAEWKAWGKRLHAESPDSNWEHLLPPPLFPDSSWFLDLEIGLQKTTAGCLIFQAIDIHHWAHRNQTDLAEIFKKILMYSLLKEVVKKRGKKPPEVLEVFLEESLSWQHRGGRNLQRLGIKAQIWK